ncbi:tail fiber domain-containing protein [Streptomyces sp. NPDC053755]|uniref:tail fiber domain-containing protein n=1 Tax=Streptomyces sp. NPDC053755 TaxID=3155815 RepID=UPI0034170949
MVVHPDRLRSADTADRRPAPPQAPVVADCPPLNGFDILQRVVDLPVSTWRYRAGPDTVRHLGPMAQDWWEAFGLGGDDRTISPVDTNGVALVCVQALHRLLQDSRAEIADLRAEVARLTAAKGHR